MAERVKSRQPSRVRRYAVDPSHYQPGAILHECILGAFKMRGLSFEVWIKEKGITPASARAATFGQSRGPRGQALRARLIEVAGEDLVKVAYLRRMREHMAEVEGSRG